MKVYSGDEVDIPHSELLRLRADGKVKLGIGQSTAETISSSSRLKPTKTAAGGAFTFWSWAAAGGLFYSIYLSFTSHWWWFIVGLIGGTIVHTANKGANQSNLLDAAMIDAEFYTKVARLGGWQYAMMEEDAEPYFTTNFRIGQEVISKFRSGLGVGAKSPHA